MAEIDMNSTALADRLAVAEEWAELLPDQRSKIIGVATNIATTVRDVVSMTSAEYNTVENLKKSGTLRRHQNGKRSYGPKS